MTRNPDRGDIMRLLDDYNSNPDKFTDDQAEKIAQVAKAYGVSFKRENKVGRKLAFDLADTALLGLVPNDWRPTSRGQETFGETGIDREIYADGPSLAGRAGARLNKGLQYTKRKSADLSAINRGNTSYLSKLRDEFMEPMRNQNLLDMLDEVRHGIPMGGYG